MLGQDSGQRSTLTLNHGLYYVDTSNNCDNQGGCLASNPASSHGVSVFQGGQTYYVYFVYGKASTQLTFDIYLGPNDETGKWKVAPVRGIFDTDTYVFNPAKGTTPWLGTPEYHKDTNLLTVTVDLSKSTIAAEFASQFSDACQPTTYCAVSTGNDGTMSCGCKGGTNCKDAEVCSWGPEGSRLPGGGLLRLRLHHAVRLVGAPQPVDPPKAGKFSDNAYFDKGNVQFKTVDTEQVRSEDAVPVHHCTNATITIKSEWPVLARGRLGAAPGDEGIVRGIHFKLPATRPTTVFNPYSGMRDRPWRFS